MFYKKYRNIIFIYKNRSFLINTLYNATHFTKTLYYLYNKSDKINMLQITESEILEAYDSYELSESELIELYSEGYISENTMDQLIEMGIFDEILYEQEALEEGFLKRHGKSILKGALVAGALGAGAGALVGGGALPVAATVGAATGIGHMVDHYLNRKKFDKKKLDSIRAHRLSRDISNAASERYLNINRSHLGMNADKFDNQERADFYKKKANYHSNVARDEAKTKYPSLIDIIKRKKK